MTSLKFRALTHNDHKLFFEALGEHGKDFQNIQQYIAQKGSKNSNKSTSSNHSFSSDHQINVNNSNRQQSAQLDAQEKREQEKKDEDKKREQIRNFYNKLYIKLSQLIGKLDDRVEKVNQELYLLINYGEIWKKHGFKFNTKTKKLLEELVHQGYTTIRFKNKNVRLRTPPCKALKKINEIGIDEKVKVVSQRELPKDVIVEFHPATNRDWLKVQSMSQNPRLRAKLSMQKRVLNIIDFLENKWNVSQDKLSRTVDAWLKIPPSNNNNQSLDDPHHQPNQTNNNTDQFNSNQRTEENNISSKLEQSITSGEVSFRIRLKPSPQHELKEVNITRVVPDNHLDLSLTAYIKRLSESKGKNDEHSATASKRDSSVNNSQISNLPIADDIAGVIGDAAIVSMHNHFDVSQGATSTSSRLPLSLTTPDSSILLERSSTSDQPSLARARRDINLLQTLAGHFEGYENSRTACEDTQDRSLLERPFATNIENRTINTDHIICNETPSNEFCSGGNAVHHRVSFADIESSKPAITLNDGTLSINNSISALFDEDAVIETNLTLSSKPLDNQTQQQQQNFDSQSSKSVDPFNIPKDKTLGDWLDGNRQDRDDGENANDAFPSHQILSATIDEVVSDQVKEVEIKPAESSFELGGDNPTKSKMDSLTQPQNHMIEMKKIAEGWTKHEESSITVGELYLAFKCPEKIVLDYTFEQYTYQLPESGDSIDITINNAYQQQKILTVIPESPSNKSLIFKLLTAANLSLTYMEQQRQNETNQQNQRFKKRKGSNNQANNSIKYLTIHDIEATNERVEQAIKNLQPTRLSVFRRAR